MRQRGKSDIRGVELSRETSTVNTPDPEVCRSVSGNTSGIYPECGTPIPDEIKEKLTADPPKQ